MHLLLLLALPTVSGEYVAFITGGYLCLRRDEEREARKKQAGIIKAALTGC